MDICFWCCKPKEKDQKGNPTFFNYEPCSQCGDWWNKGILVIEVSTEPNGNPPIIEELFPTGLWVVVDKENVKNVLKDYPYIETILEKKIMYVNEDDWKKIIKIDKLM